MRRTWLVVAGVPLLTAVAGTLALLAIRPDLPDPVATHWGTSGADGFTALRWAWLPVLLGPALGLVLGVLLVLVAGREPAARRLGAGLGAGPAGFVTVLALGSLWIQRGLADARDAPGVGTVLVVALAVGLGLGAGAAALVRAAVAVAATGPVPGPRLDLAPGERAVWSAWTAAPPAVLALAAAGLVPTLVLVAIGIAPAFLLLVSLLVGVVLVATLAARVWVDERGLTVRSPLGRPAHRVPLAEIAAVAVVTVDPLGDFGGWGHRFGRRGRSGVVLRRGPAVEVTRADGRRFAVTVDGADEAAALLTTLVDRDRARPR